MHLTWMSRHFHRTLKCPCTAYQVPLAFSNSIVIIMNHRLKNTGLPTDCKVVGKLKYLAEVLSSNLLRQIPTFLKLTPVRGIHTEQPTFSSVPKWNYLLIILALHCKCWKLFFKKDKKKKNEVPICRNLAGTEHIERKKASRRLHRRNTSGVISVLVTSL